MVRDLIIVELAPMSLVGNIVISSPGKASLIPVDFDHKVSCFFLTLPT